MTLLNTVNIGGTDFGLANNSVLGTCATPAGSEVKVCTFSDSFELKAGLNIAVKFTYANTYGDGSTTYPKLSVNGISYPIKRSDDSYVMSGDWANGQTAVFMFSGADFIFTNLSTACALASLPTDAVLHYSFDDVPDYPDGTADVRLIDNNTYDIQSGNYKFINNGGATITNSNGNAQISITGGNSAGVTIRNEYISNKIIKLKLNVSALIGKLSVLNGISTKVAEITEVGTYEISYLHNNTEETYSNFYIFCFSTGNSCTFTVEKIYIGNGSYSTPIIDNANGQNNATNNGGIATRGVSGKGAYFLNGKYADMGVINLSQNFTVSVWVKPGNSTTGLNGRILSKSNFLSISNGSSSIDSFYITLYDPSTSSSQYIYNTYLPINKYTHIVVVKNGTNLKLYLDAVLTKSITVGNSVNTNNNPMYLSNSDNARPQSIDDLQIFDRALTENEVMALYLNKANTPKYYSWADWKLHQMEQS